MMNRRISITRLLAVVLALGVFAGSMGELQAQKVDRTKKPTPGPVPKAAFPPFTEATLKNGVRVIIVEDHKQPLVFFRTMILSGNAADGSHIGAASAVASMLQKGTKSHNADDIAKKIDFYGASIGAGSGLDDVNIFTSSLKQYMNDVLPIYADVIRNPTFPKDELDKYITQTVNQLKVSKKSSGDPGRMMGRKVLYGDHPYGAIPTEEAAKALSPEVLAEWHKKNFVANNAVIAVVGDVTKGEIIPVLEKYFGDWQKGTPEKPVFPAVEQKKNLPIYLIDRPGSVQSNIRLQRIGIKRNDPRYDAASFLASVYAGNGNIGFMNRLFQNIREKHGYTYTPGGSLTASLDKGVLVAVAEVRNAVTDSALEQMLLEYRRLANEPISKEDLQLAKGIITGDYLMSLSDAGTTSSRALNIIEYGLPKDYYSTFAQRLNKLSSEELQRVAREVYPADDVVIIVTGDASQIEDKLKRFGPVEIYNIDLEPAGASGALTPSDIPLDQVINKYYAAINKSALEKVKDRSTKGSLTFSAGGQSFDGTFNRIEATGNKVYEEAIFPMIVSKRWINGTQAWQSQAPPGAQGKAIEETGEPLQQELSDAIFNEELRLTDPAWKVTLLGKSKSEGGDLYQLSVLQPGATAPAKWYISANDFRLVKKETPSPEGMSVISFSDFRTVDGALYPFALHVEQGPQEIDFHLTEIKHNTSPDPSVFTYSAK